MRESLQTETFLDSLCKGDNSEHLSFIFLFS